MNRQQHWELMLKHRDVFELWEKLMAHYPEKCDTAAVCMEHIFRHRHAYKLNDQARQAIDGGYSNARELCKLALEASFIVDMVEINNGVIGARNTVS